MKILTIVTTVLLILSFIFCGILWFNLDTTRNQLRITTTQLETTEMQLNATETELAITKEQLDAAKTQLTDTEFQLSFTQNKLTNTEAELQTTVTQLSTTEKQLKETETRLVTTENLLETAKDEQKQMLSDYSSLSAQIYLRQGEDEDTREFITPKNEMVSAKVTEIAGSYSEDVNELWRDYDRLYKWVVNNIEYSSDSHTPILPPTIGGRLIWTKDFWRMPEETIEDEAGDCEDMAVLLVSLMLSYNNQGYAVWAIGISNEDSGHLAVAFPVAGNRLAILDPAGNYYTGSQQGWLQSYDINRAVNDWLSRWKQKIPGAKISCIFSNDFYREFADTEEFINWVKER